MSTGRVLGPRNVMSIGCVVRTRTASGISMMVVITIFRFGMGAKIGFEMPISRAFGPRDVMSDGCVVKKTCVVSGISMTVVITISGSGRRQQMVCHLFLLESCGFLVRVSCARYRCRMNGSWAVMFLNRRQVLL